MSLIYKFRNVTYFLLTAQSTMPKTPPTTLTGFQHKMLKTVAVMMRPMDAFSFLAMKLRIAPGIAKIATNKNVTANPKQYLASVNTG